MEPSSPKILVGRYGLVARDSRIHERKLFETIDRYLCVNKAFKVRERRGQLGVPKRTRDPERASLTNELKLGICEELLADPYTQPNL